MENQSQNNGQRRRRNNRSGGGNRNRQNNRGGRSGGNRSGGNRSGGNRNSRNRNRSRRKPEPKPTAWQKFLSAITFGALGKPKKKAKKKPAAKKTQSAASTKPKTTTPRKKKPRTEVTSQRLYVGNLAYSTTEAELEELFRGVGSVQSAEVVTNSRTQQSKGFAFVEMVSIDEAKRAVDVLDDEEFMGRKLIVSGARSEGPHDSDKEESSNEEKSEPALSNSTSDTEA
jgi:hypothetical protein